MRGLSALGRVFSSSQSLPLGSLGCFRVLGNVQKRWKVHYGRPVKAKEIKLVHRAVSFSKGASISRDPTAPDVWRPIPRTPGQRNAVFIDYSMLWKGKPMKHLTVGLRRKGGRNNHGRVTVRGRGGGHKKRLRIIDWKRDVLDIPGTIERIEYDPNRTAFIALVSYRDLPPKDRYRYIICPQSVSVGQVITASRSSPVELKPGNAMPVKFIPLGTLVHCIEVLPKQGAKFVRSAGCFGQIISRDPVRGYVQIKLQSREQRLVKDNCMATIGMVSNPNRKHVQIGKAGRNRWRGFRPKVRGVAMNACDHPHGGGEGRNKSNKPSSSPWGWTCKGRRTRPKSKKDFRIVIRRYQAKK